MDIDMTKEHFNPNRPILRWVKNFIVGFRLAPRVFSWFSSFPPSWETNIFKLKFDQDRRPT